MPLAKAFGKTSKRDSFKVVRAVAVGVLRFLHLPSYLMAAPVEVIDPSVVNSMNR